MKPKESNEEPKRTISMWEKGWSNFENGKSVLPVVIYAEIKDPNNHIVELKDALNNGTLVYDKVGVPKTVEEIINVIRRFYHKRGIEISHDNVYMELINKYDWDFDYEWFEVNKKYAILKIILTPGEKEQKRQKKERDEWQREFGH